MDYSSISLKIITTILDFAYPVSFSDYWRWSPALPLAQVCRSWRNYLLPKLHETAYVLTARNIETCSKSCAYLCNGTLNTTISLGYGHYVKKIVILDNYYLPLPQLKTSTPDTWTPLDFPDNMWPGLTQIHVNAYACTLPADQKHSYLDSIPEPSSNFLQHLPNVATFVFKFANDDYFVSASAYRVVDAISVVVDGTSLSTESQSYCLYLDSYTQISAHYSSESVPIMSYYTLSSLDHLAFIDVPKPITWSVPFDFTTSEQILNFASIKYLKLGFRDVPMSWRTDITSEEQLNVPHPAYQLRFPNLQRLALCNSLYDSDFFVYLGRALPQKINLVTLTGNFEEIYPIISVLPQVGFLKVDIWSQRKVKNLDTRPFFDSAFDSQSIADIATLRCNTSHLPDCLEDICWPKLVKLSIDSCMSINHIFNLLNCLPNLEKFNIAWISERGSKVLPFANWDTISELKPLNTKVWRLKVGNFRFANTNPFPINSVLHLAARLVNLQTAILKHGTPIDTSGFMDDLHDKHPHTAEISVNFKLISDS